MAEIDPEIAVRQQSSVADLRTFNASVSLPYGGAEKEKIEQMPKHWHPNHELDSTRYIQRLPSPHA